MLIGPRKSLDESGYRSAALFFGQASRAAPLVLLLFVIFSVGLFCVLLVSMM